MTDLHDTNPPKKKKIGEERKKRFKISLKNNNDKNKKNCEK